MSGPPTVLSVVYDAEMLRTFEDMVREFTIQACEGMEFETQEMWKLVNLVFLSNRNKYRKDLPDMASTHSIESRVVRFFSQRDDTPLEDAVFRFHRAVTSDEQSGPIYVSDASTVVYFSLNPVDETSVLPDFQKNLTAALVSGFEGFHVESEYLGALMRKKPDFKFFSELDIDTKDPGIVRKILKDVTDKIPDFDDHVVFCVETRGGYHVVIKTPMLSVQDMKNITEVSKGTLHKTVDRIGDEISSSYMDYRSHARVPVPGTLQAGFKVRLVAFDDLMTL